MGWGSAIGSAVGGVAGAFGSILGANKAASSAREINNAQIGLSREQMNFQESMSNTAHQREVADLRAAGLNPILSATGGSGASSPTGSMAQLQNPGAFLASGYSSAGQSVGGAINSAFQNSKISEEMKQIKADTATKQEAVNLVKEQARTQKTQQIANSASAKASIASAEQAKATAKKIDQNYSIDEVNEIVAAVEKYYMGGGENKNDPAKIGFLGHLRGAMNSINPFVSSAKTIARPEAMDLLELKRKYSKH